MDIVERSAIRATVLYMVANIQQYRSTAYPRQEDVAGQMITIMRKVENYLKKGNPFAGGYSLRSGYIPTDVIGKPSEEKHFSKCIGGTIPRLIK